MYSIRKRPQGRKMYICDGYVPHYGDIFSCGVNGMMIVHLCICMTSFYGCNYVYYGFLRLVTVVLMVAFLYFMIT